MFPGRVVNHQLQRPAGLTVSHGDRNRTLGGVIHVLIDVENIPSSRLGAQGGRNRRGRGPTERPGKGGRDGFSETGRGGRGVSLAPSRGEGTCGRKSRGKGEGGAVSRGRREGPSRRKGGCEGRSGSQNARPGESGGHR